MSAHDFHGAFTSPVKIQMNCHDCTLSRLCLPGCLHHGEVDLLENIVKRNRPLHKGDHLFRAGEPMQQIYALRSGALKTYLLDQDGNQQITGFILPGELVGLDAFGSSNFPSYAEALETSLVCTIPLAELEELAGYIPSLRKQLLATLSRELHEEQQHYSHNRESAEQRLAVFLLNLSLRYGRRSLSATSFILSMSRSEIGNYLGLTTETVSRLFSRMRQQGLLEIKGRELRLMHPAALNQIGRIEARQQQTV
ncbi:MAG: fumarate/nitrate reduction transcriptional regulator Fnr [Pseudomonas sp.]|uniref:fumarate/nitrate reduction transcriptional regulator Fnr n=1 Tax=Pseudomonas sp. TaxID=306 RepID=UPI00299F3B86|nr:fumarate/nitrate reduction transcriptional regulator Fnr [Pseudomonas sp.]MDX1723393.1 fumarate/nitrate reduction transcriptional regulator Fnr [Pseudomonas sp.]